VASGSAFWYRKTICREYANRKDNYLLNDMDKLRMDGLSSEAGYPDDAK
jgi:hypothetical protein